MSTKKVSTLARDALKLQGKIDKVIKEVEAAESYLNYRRGEYAKLPEDIREARAEYQAAQDKVTEALAELSKPLENYHYEARYYSRDHTGPRRYSSPAAQAAWDAEKHATYAEERLQDLEASAAKTLDEYTTDEQISVDSEWAKFQNLDALHSATMARIRDIMGDSPLNLEALATPATKAEDPTEYTIPARETPGGYRVCAENLATLKGKEVSFRGVLFYANQIREWCKLAGGEVLTVIYDEAMACLTLVSSNARATFKGQGDKPAPALVFASV